MKRIGQMLNNEILPPCIETISKIWYLDIHRTINLIKPQPPSTINQVNFFLNKFFNLSYSTRNSFNC